MCVIVIRKLNLLILRYNKDCVTVCRLNTHHETVFKKLWKLCWHGKGEEHEHGKGEEL